MKKITILILLFFSLSSIKGQNSRDILYSKMTAMVPMRDGVKLFTTILYPANTHSKYPILIQRTPYGADFPIKSDSMVSLKRSGFSSLASGGYIFVIQDIRGNINQKEKCRFIYL